MEKGRVLYKIKSLDKSIIRCLIFDLKDDIKKLNAPTPTQMQILEYIIDNDMRPIYQRDLEKILNLRRATVSGVLQTMEKNGLIDRVVDDLDARSKKIILNEESKNIFLRKKESICKIENRILHDISNEDLNIFIKVVDKMRENLNEKI